MIKRQLVLKIFFLLVEIKKIHKYNNNNYYSLNKNNNYYLLFILFIIVIVLIISYNFEFKNFQYFVKTNLKINYYTSCYYYTYCCYYYNGNKFQGNISKM